MTVTLKPGIHKGIPERDYHALDLCSASRLKVLHATTPMHLRQQLDAGEQDSASMRIGSALHCRTLEGPAEYAKRYAIGGPINPKTGRPFGSDTKAHQEWALSQGRPTLTYDEDEQVTAMAAAIWAHPSAALLLKACKDRELTVVGELHGTMCKARIDAHGTVDGAGVIVDIKTTARGAGPEDFQRAIGGFGYGLQAALYEALAAKAGLPVGHFVFIAVESAAPYAVAAYRLKNEVMVLYEQVLPRLLETYTACAASGRWNGWPDDVVEIGLPGWTRSTLEREVNATEVRDA
jgi:exodeoxyribonuclease VIII